MPYLAQSSSGSYHLSPACSQPKGFNGNVHYMQDAGPPAANGKTGTSWRANPIELDQETGQADELPVYPPSCTTTATNLVTSRTRYSNASAVENPARQLRQLLKRYSPVDFCPRQGFQRDWDAVSTIKENWKEMTSACLLHLNGDIATVVRWIGGPHTAAHAKPTETLAKLKNIIDPDIWSDLERILISGAPALCNAVATEENFQAYRTNDNHTSVRENQEEFAKSIVKQSKRGLTLIMDPDLIHFALNVHVTPQGIVDLMHPRRKPRLR